MGRKPVSRNFTLSILSPTCYKTRRKESLHTGRAPGEAGVFLRAIYWSLKWEGEDGCSAVPNCPHLLRTHACSCPGTSTHSSSCWLTLHTIHPAGRRAVLSFWTASGKKRSRFMSPFRPCEQELSVSSLVLLSSVFSVPPFPFLCFLPRGSIIWGCQHFELIWEQG